MNISVWKSHALLIRYGARLWQSCVSCPAEILDVFIMVQATYNSENLHGAMGHERIQELLLPIGTESKRRIMITLASCLNFCQAVGKSARVEGGSLTGREAERMDPKQIGSKATHTHGTNT